MKKAKEEIQEHINHIIQTTEEDFKKSFNGNVAPSSNDLSNLRQCIIERIKPFQDQLARYEEIKPMPDSINLKND